MSNALSKKKICLGVASAPPKQESAYLIRNKDCGYKFLWSLISANFQQLPKFLNATPHVRAARPSATRPFGRSASGTFSLADARENVVNNKR